MNENTCIECGAELPGLRRKFCSDKCSMRLHNRHYYAELKLMRAERRLERNLELERQIERLPLRTINDDFRLLKARNQIEKSREMIAAVQLQMHEDEQKLQSGGSG